MVGFGVGGVCVGATVDVTVVGDGTILVGEGETEAVVGVGEPAGEIVGVPVSVGEGIGVFVGV